jgi:hypothetical protein
MDNLIIINAPFGARGHQLGRLLCSCNNVLWYDHFKNGSQPWFPSFGLGRTFSKYHFTRRFEGAYGLGTDKNTIPPVLERARATGSNPYPHAELNDWLKKVYPNYIVMVLHDDLDVTKVFFQTAKHIIIYPQDIDELVSRLNNVGADYRWGKDPDRTLREVYTKEGLTFQESIKEVVQKTVNSYEQASEKDIVLHSVDEALDINNFLEICNKFGLEINYDNFNKVFNFVQNDKATPLYEVRNLHNQDVPSIETFLAECSKLNFKNNTSLETIKFNWCINNGGSWWGVFKKDQLVSMSGMHPFKDGYRVLFRGAQIEQRPIKGLNRYQFQSWGMWKELPMQIEWARWKGTDKIYITTNVSNDASGKMNRIHRAFSALEKAGVVEHCGDEEIFFTQQSIWRVNIQKYFEVRKIYEG